MNYSTKPISIVMSLAGIAAVVATSVPGRVNAETTCPIDSGTKFYAPSGAEFEIDVHEYYPEEFYIVSTEGALYTYNLDKNGIPTLCRLIDGFGVPITVEEYATLQDSEMSVIAKDGSLGFKAVGQGAESGVVINPSF